MNFSFTKDKVYSQEFTYIVPSEGIKITGYGPVEEVTDRLGLIASEYIKLKNIHTENGHRCMILPKGYNIESI